MPFEFRKHFAQIKLVQLPTQKMVTIVDDLQDNVDDDNSKRDDEWKSDNEGFFGDPFLAQLLYRPIHIKFLIYSRKIFSAITFEIAL